MSSHNMKGYDLNTWVDHDPLLSHKSMWVWHVFLSLFFWHTSQWQIQDPRSGSLKFSNKHIGKNIVKNNFNLFILINYTIHSCLLRNFIFRIHVLKSLNNKLRVNVIKYITLTWSHYSVSSCLFLPLLMFWSLTWSISAIKIFRGSN